MKLKLFLPTTILFVLALEANSQKCKPDYSKLDKIEKKQIDVWNAELYETPLMKTALLTTSSVSITFSIGRMDTVNGIMITLQKQEESAARAVLESSLKGAKGNEFYLGLKDGEPLKFIASDAINETKATTMGKLVTTVQLSCEFKSEDLQNIKDALTGKIIDAVRVKLENGVIINQDVKEKNGERAKNKSVCFFNFLQEKGLMK